MLLPVKVTVPAPAFVNAPPVPVPILLWITVLPEPVTVKGLMIWDLGFETDEDRAAYTRDQTACNMELFGSPGFPR